MIDESGRCVCSSEALLAKALCRCNPKSECAKGAERASCGETNWSSKRVFLESPFSSLPPSGLFLQHLKDSKLIERTCCYPLSRFGRPFLRAMSSAPLAHPGQKGTFAFRRNLVTRVLQRGCTCAPDISGKFSTSQPRCTLHLGFCSHAKYSH